MGNESFKPEYICYVCAKQLKDVSCSVKPEAQSDNPCDLCGSTALVMDTKDVKRGCPVCKEMVPLDEWSFTPVKKVIRQKCDRCAKKEKYLKSPIDRRKF